MIKLQDIIPEYNLEEDENPCWKGYEQIGMKTKNGKQVPNCVPIKEGKLTEAHRSMSNNVAKEIIRQLGGRRFQMFVGAKKFLIDKKALFFKIGNNSKKINGIKIYYNHLDLYDIEFLRVSKNGIKVAKKLKNIYADQLQEIFTRYTGMYTAL